MKAAMKQLATDLEAMNFKVVKNINKLMNDLNERYLELSNSFFDLAMKTK